MIPKPLTEITGAEVQALIDTPEVEGRTIDYKEELPGGTEGAKREFLADVASFANATGGDIVFGIKEKRDASGKPTGVPERVAPLAPNLEPDILRLEAVIRTGLDPRIPGVRFLPVDTPAGKVLVLRVPRSWSAPHMVTLGTTSRFYSRGSAGKYPLDVTEIRAAFVASDQRATRVARFRDERLGQIVSGETPVPLLQDGPGRAVLHVVPVTALDPTFTIELPEPGSVATYLRPMGVTAWNYRYNFDGLLTYFGDLSQRSVAYLQVFRSGSLESLNSAILAGRNNELLSVAFERYFIESLRNAIELYRRIAVEPPLFVLASLLGVRGRRIQIPGRPFAVDNAIAVDRDVLLLPDVLVSDFDDDPAAILKPVNDAVWQAAGWPCSVNYHKNGRWLGDE